MYIDNDINRLFYENDDDDDDDDYNDDVPRMFDDDDDGHLSVTELSEVVTELGESLTKTELNQMLKQAK